MKMQKREAASLFAFLPIAALILCGCSGTLARADRATVRKAVRCMAVLLSGTPAESRPVAEIESAARHLGIRAIELQSQARSAAEGKAELYEKASQVKMAQEEIMRFVDCWKAGNTSRCQRFADDLRSRALK